MKFTDGEKVLVVSFGELWLRGRNRGDYINLLRNNLNKQLEGEKYKFEPMYDRFLLRLQKGSDEERIKAKLSKLFGISNVTVSHVTKPTLASITRTARKMLRQVKGEERSVRINSHRTYKEFDFDSRDIIGKVLKVAKAAGFTPTTHGFTTDMHINVTKDAAFLTCEKVRGQGGLPVRSSGKGVVLLSGGIDSPVAAWYAMKRGIEPIYVHIHGYRDAEDALQSKVPALIKILSGYGSGSKTYYIPAYVLQSYSMKAGKYELILLKAFMLRIAEKIAEKEGAGAIITGESLGQVASQTMQNLSASQDGIKLPILRPLVGFDKDEIIRVARSIGTYDESIRPYKDVCSINAKNPATATQVKKMKELAKSVGLTGIVNRSLRLAKVVDGGAAARR